MRLLWVWSVTRGTGPGWGGCDDPSGARIERGGSTQAGADDALTETRRGAGSPGAEPAVRIVDPGPLGGLLGREGHWHEAQPGERGSPRRGAEVAPGRDLVRGAGGPAVRAQKISWAPDGRAAEVWWSSPLADTGDRPCPPTPILPRSRSAPTRSSSPLS